MRARLSSLHKPLGEIAMKKMIRMATMAGGPYDGRGRTVSKASGRRVAGGGRGNPSARILAALDSVHASDAIKAKADSIVKATAALTAPLMEAARGRRCRSQHQDERSPYEAERSDQGSPHEGRGQGHVSIV